MGNPYAPLSKASENHKKDENTKPVEETQELELTVPEGEGTTNEPENNENTEEVPEGNISEITDWVGDDKDRAQLALDAENGQDTPRKTLVKHLEEVING